MRALICCLLLFVGCQKEVTKLAFDQSVLQDFTQLQGSVAQDDETSFRLFEKQYKRNFELQFSHNSIHLIPRHIHVIWLGPSVFPLESIDNLRRWRAHHPDWKFTFWTDRDWNAPLKDMDVKRLDNFQFHSLEKEFEESSNWAEKSDILRLEILAQHGGIYIDHDADCLRSFDSLNRGLRFYAALEKGHDPIEGMGLTLGIGIIGAEPSCNVIMRAMELIKERWEKTTKLFPAEDAISSALRVAHRTYLSYTLATLEKLDDQMIVFPADYFYPKESEGLYSKHYYGTSWNPYGKVSISKRFYEMMSPFLKQEALAIRVIALIATLFLLASLFTMRKHLKVLSLFALCLTFVGCEKKETPNQDFDHLMGKGLKSWKHVVTQRDVELLDFYRTQFEERKVEHVNAQIPRVFHFIWVGPREFPKTSVQNVESWIKHHPEWKIKFWTDRLRPLPHPKMELNIVGKESLERLSKHYVASDNYAEKSDLLRYEILLKEGGIYVDHDVVCFKSFEPLLQTHHLFCGIEPPHKPISDSSISVCNNLIGTIPHHPFLEQTIQNVLNGWDRYSQMYPGDDRESKIYRVFYRTFCPFDDAVAVGLKNSNLNNVVFPAGYFNKIENQYGLYSDHQYTGTWYQSEDPFEKLMRQRLMKMSKKLNKILLITGVSVGVNLLLIIGFGWMVQRRLRAKRA